MKYSSMIQQNHVDEELIVHVQDGSKAENFENAKGVAGEKIPTFFNKVGTQF